MMSKPIKSSRKQKTKCKVFALRLREIRERHYESQEDLSGVMGHHSRGVAYGGWERCQAEPSLQDLIKLCKHFNVTADWLLGLDDNERHFNASDVDCDTKAEFAGEVQKMRQDVKAASANLFMIGQRLEKLEAKLK